MNKELEDEKGLEKEPVKKKSVKKSTEDEVLNKNSIDINPKMNEAATRTVVLGWGRMNPITSGHEILVNKIKAVARANKATPVVYISHSQDAKKNPLAYEDKVMLAKQAFGNIIQKSNSKTIIQIMKELEDRFDKVILVAGDDRVAEFTKLLNKYNGADYNIKEIEVVSAGKRADPDSDDAKDMSAANMSASVMRKLASEGNIEAFKKGLPKGLQSDYRAVYDLVRSGMKIAEMMEEDGQLIEALTVQQRRVRGLIMRKYKVKIANARRRLRKKPATMDKLKVRARKAAIKILRKKLAGKKGENYVNLTPSEKSMIDKRLEKKKSTIEKIAKRLLPSVRRADMQRLSGASKSNDDSTKKESFDIDFEQFLGESKVNQEFESLFEEKEVPEMKQSIYTKRYHQMFNKEGTIKLDRRFRAFRAKKLEEGAALDKVVEKHKDEKYALANRQRAEKADAKIRDIRLKAQEEFETDEALLRFIEETTNDIYDSILLDEEKSNEGLKDKAEKSGISLAILKKVYDRGMGAWQTSHRPGTTPQQWAFARVNSFITGGKTRTTGDADLWAKHSGKKSVEEGSKPGLWDNIRKRREKGLPRLKPGQDGYPDTLNIKEVGGAGDRGTTKLANRYKKDTPGQSVAEQTNLDKFKKYTRPVVKTTPKIERSTNPSGRTTDHVEWKVTTHTGEIQRFKSKKEAQALFDSLPKGMSEEVSQQQLNDLEKFADRLLAKFKIDVEFTRHFADRMNDDRNNPPITVGELQKVFKKIASTKGAEIRQNPDIEAVLKDIQNDLNLPIVINYDKNKDEFEVVNKTIMRKKNFGTSSKVIKL
jgi:nicotinic acid mononucleotide adenylyltransferase